jgi:uncharacterized protein (TIGR02300 family)
MRRNPALHLALTGLRFTPNGRPNSRATLLPSRSDQLAKPDRGTKREDPETGKKFYDLGRDPIVSPYTGKSYPRSYFESASVTAARKAAAEVEEEEEVEVEEPVVAGAPEIVSLEEADAEEAVEDEVPEEVEDVEEAEDIGEDDTDAFLEEDEDEDENLDFDVTSDER